MNALHKPTIDYYEKHAADLSGLYANADVSDLWELLAQALPMPGPCSTHRTAPPFRKSGGPGNSVSTGS